MNRIKASYFVAGALIAGFLFSSAGAGRLSSSNPADFRNSLHPDYTNFQSRNSVVIPDILPVPVTGVLQASFNDILISETSGPANFTQNKADITALKGGRTVAVWEDNRLGPIAVLMQMYLADGTPAGANATLIYGDSYNLNDPVVTADTLGNFYVVWREDANGFLQAARFDSLGAVTTPLFFVSDTLAGGYTGDFDAACLPDGRLVVVWESYTFGNDVVFRVFASDGISATAQLTANSDGPLNKHWSPAVATAANGDIGLVWEGDALGPSDIYFRLFDKDGTAYNFEISISDSAASDSSRYLPSLSFSAVDGFLAGWVDLRDGENIYLQRIDAAGALIGDNILLTDQTAVYSNWELDLAVTSAGEFLASWTLYATENSIELQRFGAGVVKNGDPLSVSESTNLQRFYSAAASNEVGNIFVVWTDLVSGLADIHGSVLDNTGTVLISDHVVNDETTGAASLEPAVTQFNKFEWTIAFSDQRRDAGDIMLQRVYVGGTLYGDNRLVNTDPAGGYQSQPAVASGADKACISWTDERENGISGRNIFCRFTLRDVFLTDDIVVNDDYAGSAAHYESDCAIGFDGTTLVVWTDTRGGNAKIYGQLFDAFDIKIGDNILIGPGVPAETGEMPKVSADGNGNFSVAYLNRLTSGGPTVEVKQVSSTGSVADAFSFASDMTGYQIDGFDGQSRNGLFHMVWQGYGPSGKELYYTVFDTIGVNGLVSTAVTDNMDAKPDAVDIDVDDEGHVIITWSDYRTGLKIPFRQIFDPLYAPIEPNVPTSSFGGPYMQAPVTAAFRGRGVFVWADARSNGLNVYASQVLYSPTDTDGDESVLPVSYALEQNYPNPFNPTTAIHFSMAQAGRVRLDVFNLLGQKVKTLLDQNYPTGGHTVIWDGTSDAGRQVASGVYFYRLTADDFSQTRKMILMK